MENEKMTALAIVERAGVVKPSKAEAQRVAFAVRDAVESGGVGILDAFAALRFMAEVYELYNADHERAAIAAHVKDVSAGTGKVVHEAGVFALRGTKTTYDYQGDTILQDLMAAAETLKEQIDRRKEFLKSLVVPVEEKYRGEVITVRPPVVTSTDGFAFSLNKG